MDTLEPQEQSDDSMDIIEDPPIPEEVTLDSESDEEVIPIPTSYKKPTATRQNVPTMSSAAPGRSIPKPPILRTTKPDVIDLTRDDEVAANDNQAPTYSSMDDDLELIEVDPVPPAEVAEEHKTKGNEHFKVGQYYQALEMYTKAIQAMPSEASYYGNRSACNMMLKRYKEALADVRTSLQLDPAYEKGYLRQIRTTLALGNVKECELAFEAAAKQGVRVEANAERQNLQWLKNQLAEIEASKAKLDYRKLVFLTSRGLEIATADNGMKMVKADALIRLGRHVEAQELCTEVLQNDARCAEALYIRALCLFLEDSMDKSIQFVRQGLQYAPDNSSFQNLYKKLKQVKELRESGSTKYASMRYEESKKDYLQCLSIVGNGELNNAMIQSKLHFNIALIAQKLKNVDETVDACGKAIALNSKYLKAYIHRARAYLQKEMYDEAIHDFEAALRIDPALRDLKKELNDAKIALKRSKRKDYYKILNVEKNASEDEIRKAYKKRALVHHPDRHANATEAVQKEQEKLFKDLGEAYEVLSDSKKRFRYDQGVDLMDDRSGFGGGGYDAGYDSADFINIFFGNGGVPSFRPQQRGGGTQFHSHHTFRH